MSNNESRQNVSGNGVTKENGKSSHGVMMNGFKHDVLNSAEDSMISKGLGDIDEKRLNELKNGSDEDVFKKFGDSWKHSNEVLKNFFKSFDEFFKEKPENKKARHSKTEEGGESNNEEEAEHESDEDEKQDNTVLLKSFEIVKRLIRSHTSEVQIVCELGYSLAQKNKELKTRIEDQKQEMLVKNRVLEGRCEDLSNSVARMKTDNQQQQNQISQLHKTLKEGQEQENFSKNKIRRLGDHLDKIQKRLTEEALAYKIEADDTKFELQKTKEIIENYKLERQRFILRYHSTVCCLQQISILASIDGDLAKSSLVSVKADLEKSLKEKKEIEGVLRKMNQNVEEQSPAGGCGCFGFIVKKKVKPGYRQLNETE
eukprot:c20303_g1_i1.p1 GENE.c20303_g1_i1~~c20303_g1_i1.p1  ORF type:complete len:371 (-),score=132.16 c20303_g1_i1:35-1147(-)